MVPSLGRLLSGSPPAEDTCEVIDGAKLCEGYGIALERDTADSGAREKRARIIVPESSASRAGYRPVTTGYRPLAGSRDGDAGATTAGASRSRNSHDIHAARLRHPSVVAAVRRYGPLQHADIPATLFCRNKISDSARCDFRSIYLSSVKRDAI